MLVDSGYEPEGERRIAYVTLGRLVRITSRDLDAFIEAGRVSVGVLPAVARKGA